MKGKNILITGGAGFIGSHLVDRLVRDNQVTVLDNLSSSNLTYLNKYIKNNEIKFINGDILNSEIINSACKDIDIIFHYAADPNVKHSSENPIENFKINVIGTLNVLEAARRNNVELLVFASSGGTVYGEADYPVNEEAPLKPISCYGASKASGEVYINAYSHTYGIRAICLRYGNIYGPRSTHGVIYDFYMKLRQNPKKLLILGDGQQKKCYLYITDCIEASIKAAENTNKLVETFNVASEEWITVNEIANYVVDALQLENVEFQYTGGKRGWKGDVSIIRLDISKIKKLGWKPEVSIKEGIRKYLSWLNEHC